MAIRPRPLGVIHRTVYWDSRTLDIDTYLERMTQLIEAITRYRKAGIDPDPDWFTEISDLTIDIGLMKDYRTRSPRPLG